MELHGEGLELMKQLSDSQIAELVHNTEVTCLILHTKPWKYYALCNLPYRVLKAHKSGRYDWKDTKPGIFENKVIRLRDNWKDLLKEPDSHE